MEHAREIDAYDAETFRKNEENTALESQKIIAYNNRGQLYGFILVLVILGLCFYAIHKGQEDFAKNLGTVTIIFIASIFVIRSLPNISDIIRLIKGKKPKKKKKKED